MRDNVTVRRHPRLRPVRPSGWWFDGLLLAAAVALTVALANGLLLDVDLAVRDWMRAHQTPVAYWTARVLNYLGQGGQVLLPVAVILAAAAARRARSVRPLLVVAAAFLLVYATIGPLKLVSDRAAPSAEWKAPFLPRQETVEVFNDLPAGTSAMSYPSGHVVNAIVWYWVIALLLAALASGRIGPAVIRTVRVVPPVIVVATTTYLNFHWLTDGVAAVLLGLLLERLLARVPWDDLPMPALPYGLNRPGVFTSAP